MRIYGLNNCDTCRKAIKALPDAKFVDVRGEGVPEAVLAAALATFGDALVNTRSTTWRGLDAEARQIKPVELLKLHPALMKRPLIEVGQNMYLGWTAQTQAALGL